MLVVTVWVSCSSEVGDGIIYSRSACVLRYCTKNLIIRRLGVKVEFAGVLLSVLLDSMRLDARRDINAFEVEG